MRAEAARPSDVGEWLDHADLSSRLATKPQTLQRILANGEVQDHPTTDRLWRLPRLVDDRSQVGDAEETHAETSTRPVGRVSFE